MSRTRPAPGSAVTACFGAPELGLCAEAQGGTLLITRPLLTAQSLLPALGHWQGSSLASPQNSQIPEHRSCAGPQPQGSTAVTADSGGHRLPLCSPWL